MRVLIDSRLEVNPAAELLRTPGAIVFHALDDSARHKARKARLAEVGCELVATPGAGGKVDLAGGAARARPGASSTRSTSRPASS